MSKHRAQGKQASAGGPAVADSRHRRAAAVPPTGFTLVVPLVVIANPAGMLLPGRRLLTTSPHRGPTNVSRNAGHSRRYHTGGVPATLPTS